MGERKSVAESGNLNERDVNLDFIRVLAMIFTVAIHIQPYPWGEAGALWNCIMTALLLSCNSFFYMLSGQLNLSQTFSEKKDYYRFYIKKAISILFPYAIYTCVLSLVHLVGGGRAACDDSVLFEKLLCGIYAKQCINLSLVFISTGWHAAEHTVFIQDAGRNE